MNDYISRAVALTVLDWDCASQDALNAIKAIPAADVVAVVRCRECIYWRGENDLCKGICIDFGADGYCSEGKRKDGGQDDVYEELTESLRKCGRLNMGDECICFHDGCCEAEPTCMYELMRKAADAIAELSKYANTIIRLKSEGWYLQQTKHHDGYEAISTMPLPELPKEDT